MEFEIVKTKKPTSLMKWVIVFRVRLLSQLELILHFRVFGIIEAKTVG